MEENTVKVTVDSERCFGHGRCYALAPEVFAEDEGGYCLIPRAVVSGPELVEKALVGKENCPENAISVEPVGDGTTPEGDLDEARGR